MGTCQVALLLMLISTSLRASQSVDVTVTTTYSLEYYIYGRGKDILQLEGTVLLLSTNILTTLTRVIFVLFRTSLM